MIDLCNRMAPSPCAKLAFRAASPESARASDVPRHAVRAAVVAASGLCRPPWATDDSRWSGPVGIGSRLALAVAAGLLLTLAAWAAPGANPAWAGAVRLDVALAQPVMLAGAKQLQYLKVGLIGSEPEKGWQRSPLNLAIVLDKSGSMAGEKLAHARRAAIMAVERLDRNDIVSVVVYDSSVQVLVPATRATDKASICRQIERLRAGSNTALFAGVSKGAAEVRKFLDRERINRIILLSDGLANEGPSSPEDLADLGASLKKEGISVTTLGLGLGYNEDLMTQLAARSDGNHAFVEKPEELARVFDLEFGDVMNVVAKEVGIRIELETGRPVRVLGREGDIRGQVVTATVSQLYRRQEKYLLLEVEVPAGEPGQKMHFASVQVAYNDLRTRVLEKLTGEESLRFTTDQGEVERAENKRVMIDVTSQLANDRFKLATRLRDEGKVEEARRALSENERILVREAKRLQAPTLQTMAEQSGQSAANLDETSWNRNRKLMRSLQNKTDLQQAW